MGMNEWILIGTGFVLAHLVPASSMKNWNRLEAI